MRIPHPKKTGTPQTTLYLGGQRGVNSKASDMTSEGFGEIFEGDSADPCAGIFLLMSMGGRANGQVVSDDQSIFY
jgi:hypothetical protein